MARIDLNENLHAQDLFSDLRKEEEIREDKKFIIHPNKNLEKILSEFEQVANLGWIETYTTEIFDRFYNTLDTLSGIYGNKDLLTLSAIAKDYEKIIVYGDIFGIFFSCLINKSSSKEITLLTSGFDFHFIGNKNNGKKIIVEGDLGDQVGRGMKKGLIKVSGNTKDNTGIMMAGGKLVIRGCTGTALGQSMINGTIHVSGDTGNLVGEGMNGGELEIKGNTGDYLGVYMRAGKISVDGYAGFNIGHGMTGGKIYLNSDYTSISRAVHGGEIYHKGNPIILYGKPVKGADIKWS